jgi:hypothetical protein
MHRREGARTLTRDAPGHGAPDARSAPSTSAPSVAHAISGMIGVKSVNVATPQSVPAITFSRPTARVVDDAVRCSPGMLDVRVQRVDHA